MSNESLNQNKQDIAMMLKEAGILFAITLIAGILLGFVHELTQNPIQIQQQKAVNEACQAVFADAEEPLSFTEMERTAGEALKSSLKENGVTIGKIYQAAGAEGQTCGYVIEAVSSQGYGGNITLYVGVDMSGCVRGVSILELSETAGLGMEAPKVLVPQFANKQVEHFTYTKNGSRTDSEVDAISGATITTKAVVDAVNGGLDMAHVLLEGGVGNE